MNFGRNPILLIIALFFLLFIVLSVVNRKSSTSLNDSDRALRTKQALTRVVNAEAKFFAQNKRYAAHVADLIPIDPKLNTDLTDGVVTIQIDSSGDKNYFVAVGSTVVTFTRAFHDGALVKKSCLQLKSAGGNVDPSTGKPYCSRKTSDVAKTLPTT